MWLVPMQLERSIFEIVWWATKLLTTHLQLILLGFPMLVLGLYCQYRWLVVLGLVQQALVLVEKDCFEVGVRFERLKWLAGFLRSATPAWVSLLI